MQVTASQSNLIQDQRLSKQTKPTQVSLESIEISLKTNGNLTRIHYLLTYRSICKSIAHWRLLPDPLHTASTFTNVYNNFLWDVKRSNRILKRSGVSKKKPIKVAIEALKLNWLNKNHNKRLKTPIIRHVFDCISLKWRRHLLHACTLPIRRDDWW